MGWGWGEGHTAVGEAAGAAAVAVAVHEVPAREVGPLPGFGAAAYGAEQQVDAPPPRTIKSEEVVGGGPLPSWKLTEGGRRGGGSG